MRRGWMNTAVLLLTIFSFPILDFFGCYKHVTKWEVWLWFLIGIFCMIAYYVTERRDE